MDEGPQPSLTFHCVSYFHGVIKPIKQLCDSDSEFARKNKEFSEMHGEKSATIAFGPLESLLARKFSPGACSIGDLRQLGMAFNEVRRNLLQIHQNRYEQKK